MTDEKIYGMHRLALGTVYTAYASEDDAPLWRGRVLTRDRRTSLVVIEQADGTLAVIRDWNFPGGARSYFLTSGDAPIRALSKKVALEAATLLIEDSGRIDPAVSASPTAYVQSHEGGWSYHQMDPEKTAVLDLKRVRIFYGTDGLEQAQVVSRLLEVAGKLHLEHAS